MSVYTKRVTGQDYVYFQWYQDGKKIEEYVGRKDDPEVVARLLGKFSEHQDYDLERFCSRVQEVTGFKVDIKETRRRLQEQQLPVSQLVQQQIARIKPETLPASVDPDTLKTQLELTDIRLQGDLVELRGKLPKSLLRKIKQEKENEARKKHRAD